MVKIKFRKKVIFFLTKRKKKHSPQLLECLVETMENQLSSVSAGHTVNHLLFAEDLFLLLFTNSKSREELYY